MPTIQHVTVEVPKGVRKDKHVLNQLNTFSYYLGDLDSEFRGRLIKLSILGHPINIYTGYDETFFHGALRDNYLQWHPGISYELTYNHYVAMFKTQSKMTPRQVLCVIEDEEDAFDGKALYDFSAYLLESVGGLIASKSKTNEHRFEYDLSNSLFIPQNPKKEVIEANLITLMLS